MLLLIKVLEHIGLEVGPGTDIHDLEKCRQCEVVVKRFLACNELRQTNKKVLQPQVSADAFVKGVFVKDQTDFFGNMLRLMIARSDMKFGALRQLIPQDLSRN